MSSLSFLSIFFVDVVAIRLSSRGRRCGRLRSRKNSAALRFSVHIHRPYSVDAPIQALAPLSRRLQSRRRTTVAAGDSEMLSKNFVCKILLQNE
jgi:hypothetical protein